MAWCDEVLGFCDASGAALDPMPAHYEVAARIEAMPMTDWVRAWREVCTTKFRDRTPGVYAFVTHFDRLSHDDPERGVAFIEAALQHEPDDEVLNLIAKGKPLGQLLVFRAPVATPLLQELALRQPRLRWLMGRQAASIGNGKVDDTDLARRLLAICDEPAYRAWEEAAYPKSEPVDFEALSVPELAAKWVEIMSRSDIEIERDHQWYDLYDYQHTLTGSEPLKALALVKAILDIEDNPNLLGILSAGMLEDLIPYDDGPVVDAVVADAADDPQFQDLLCGVWFDGLSPQVVARLKWACGQRRP
ncbi:DUF6869 domain-containing protein [Methyloceanibacter caenitepidi]|uniref:DUF6869 domain-containing protein n=1 Tax=Methyloceanibacter caenitepidi TaxID=1384459 RepID=A0A0A8JZU7_9HYPH|nr:hypothetical protein [Methyloceanibacter caenitepidi]BAQ15931.1 hypothetical protein GL4_0464 [Methyloceanibacter caenitepidi]